MSRSDRIQHHSSNPESHVSNVLDWSCIHMSTTKSIVEDCEQDDYTISQDGPVHVCYRRSGSNREEAEYPSKEEKEYSDDVDRQT